MKQFSNRFRNDVFTMEARPVHSLPVYFFSLLSDREVECSAGWLSSSVVRFIRGTVYRNCEVESSAGWLSSFLTLVVVGQ